jgi:hypothetical protein
MENGEPHLQGRNPKAVWQTSNRGSHLDRQPTEEGLKANATSPITPDGTERDGSWALSLAQPDRPNEALL